jgi:hypothetical protein
MVTGLNVATVLAAVGVTEHSPKVENACTFNLLFVVVAHTSFIWWNHWTLAVLYPCPCTSVTSQNDWIKGKDSLVQDQSEWGFVQQFQTWTRIATRWSIVTIFISFMCRGIFSATESSGERRPYIGFKNSPDSTKYLSSSFCRWQFDFDSCK